MPSIDAAGDEGLLSDAQSERQKLNLLKRRFDQSHRANQEWRASAIDSRRFCSNLQWSEEDLAKRRKAKRPSLTINKILPRVLFLAGIQRSQRIEPKLLPFEGGDVRACELMGALYKWCGTRCREPVVDSAVFMDKIVTGLGFWKVSWRFNGDLEGDLLWERIDPLAVFPDPNWLDAGWEHCEYVQQATWMAMPDAIAMWPEHEQEIRRNYGEWLSEATSAHSQQFGGGEFAGDTFSSDRSYWDAETQRLRVVETWYKQRVITEAVVRNDTGETSMEPERVEVVKRAIEMNPDLAPQFRILRMPTTTIRVAHHTADVLFDDDDSPYRSQVLPIFPTLGYYWWKVPFGMVEPLKDLQREKNVRRSTIVEIVQRSSLSGFFNNETQGARKEDLENYSAGAGKVIPFKGVKPEEIQPPQLPQALVFLETAADRDMDGVSNIHAELLGTTTARTVSGKAIKARQQSGLVVQEPVLESFTQDKEPAVRFSIDLIQQFMGVPKAARILGTMAMRQSIPGAPPGTPPQGELGQMMQAMSFLELRELLQGAMHQSFDVVIGSKPYDPSLMQQQFDRLMEAAQAFPEFTPPDVIIDAAAKAGILTEDDAMKFKAFAQQAMMLQQAQQAAAAAGQAPAPAAPPDKSVSISA